MQINSVEMGWLSSSISAAGQCLCRVAEPGLGAGRTPEFLPGVILMTGSRWFLL